MSHMAGAGEEGDVSDASSDLNFDEDDSVEDLLTDSSMPAPRAPKAANVSREQVAGEVSAGREVRGVYEVPDSVDDVKRGAMSLEGQIVQEHEQSVSGTQDSEQQNCIPNSEPVFCTYNRSTADDDQSAGDNVSHSDSVANGAEDDEQEAQDGNTVVGASNTMPGTPYSDKDGYNDDYNINSSATVQPEVNRSPGSTAGSEEGEQDEASIRTSDGQQLEQEEHNRVDATSTATARNKGLQNGESCLVSSYNAADRHNEYREAKQEGPHETDAGQQTAQEGKNSIDTGSALLVSPQWSLISEDINDNPHGLSQSAPPSVRQRSFRDVINSLRVTDTDLFSQSSDEEAGATIVSRPESESFPTNSRRRKSNSSAPSTASRLSYMQSSRGSRIPVIRNSSSPSVLRKGGDLGSSSSITSMNSEGAPAVQRQSLMGSSLKSLRKAKSMPIMRVPARLNSVAESQEQENIRMNLRRISRYDLDDLASIRKPLLNIRVTLEGIAFLLADDTPPPAILKDNSHIFIANARKEPTPLIDWEYIRNMVVAPDFMKQLLHYDSGRVPTADQMEHLRTYMAHYPGVLDSKTWSVKAASILARWVKLQISAAETHHSVTNAELTEAEAAANQKHSAAEGESTVASGGSPRLPSTTQEIKLQSTHRRTSWAEIRSQLHSLTLEEFLEIKTMPTPPPALHVALESCLRMLAEVSSWPRTQLPWGKVRTAIFSRGDFVQALLDYDYNDLLRSGKLAKLRQFIADNGNPSVNDVRRASHLAGVCFMWVKANLELATSSRRAKANSAL